MCKIERKEEFSIICSRLLFLQFSWSSIYHKLLQCKFRSQWTFCHTLRMQERTRAFISVEAALLSLSGVATWSRQDNMIFRWGRVCPSATTTTTTWATWLKKAAQLTETARPEIIAAFGFPQWVYPFRTSNCREYFSDMQRKTANS